MPRPGVTGAAGRLPFDCDREALTRDIVAPVAGAFRVLSQTPLEIALARSQANDEPKPANTKQMIRDGLGSIGV